ncbi:MAG: hypothetical protein GX361_06820 [Bacteroidales bacterium]|nr:hypothetical protein [Bacteroidales bacterium]
MKLKNIVFATLIAILAVACKQTEFDAMEQRKLTDEERWTTTHSIQQLINEFSVGDTDFPVRSNSGTLDLFRVDTIPSGGAPIVISGRVISSDDEGNIYKYIIIQEEETGMAIKISVDAGSLSGVMPVGQLIHVKCNGLVIGKYADMYQLGVLYYNDHKDDRKRGYEPGRIPYMFFKQIVQLDGMPDKEKVIIQDITIGELKKSDYTMHSRLVRLKNAYFTGRGQVNFNTVKLAPEYLFFGLPKPDIMGVPISREISDGTGTIYLSTSEFARFASAPLPPSSMKGEIVVIVGWYADNARYYDADSWQLTLRSLQDLGTGFEAYHTAQK